MSNDNATPVAAPIEEARASRARVIGRSVGAVGLFLAALHLLGPDWLSGRVDSVVLTLLGFAVVPWLLPFVKSFKLGDTEVVLHDVAELKKKIDVIEESGMLPGMAKAAGGLSERRALTPDQVWALDPNKGKFGGSPEREGRVLSATIQPKAGPRSAACRVTVEVRSTDPKRPLSGTVTFHMHPTFGAGQKYDVAVIEGVARTAVTSWGVFTIGAEADEGRTRLELDLAEVRGGTERFYAQ